MDDMDLVSHIEFIVYKGRFVPHRLLFVSVHDVNISICIQVKNLNSFTYKDIAKNLMLPNNPFETTQEPSLVVEVPLEELIVFIQQKLIPDYLNDFGHNGSTIGTMDSSTYHFLFQLLDNVKFLGVDFMGEKISLMTNRPDTLKILQAASDKLFLLRKNEKNPFWDV